MAKQKVGELPKEEQEKLIAEMKEHGLRGILTAYTVEGALANIEKAKTEKAANAGAEDEQKAPEDEQSQPDDEQKAPEDEQKAPEDEQKEDEDKKPEIDKQAEEPKAPALRCHICRSEVYDGVCSGCGFTLKRS